VGETAGWGGGFRQWIRTVLRNEAITLLRQRRRRPTLPADAANLPDPLDPIKTWEDEEYARSVIARYRDTLRPCEAAHLDAVLANDGRFDLSPLTTGLDLTRPMAGKRNGRLKDGLRRYGDNLETEWNRVWLCQSAHWRTWLLQSRPTPRDPTIMWDGVGTLHRFENLAGNPVFFDLVAAACDSVLQARNHCGAGSHDALFIKGYIVAPDRLDERAIANLAPVLSRLLRGRATVAFHFLKLGEAAVSLDYLPGVGCVAGQHCGYGRRKSEFTEALVAAGLPADPDERIIYHWPPLFSPLGSAMTDSPTSVRFVSLDPKLHKRIREGAHDLARHLVISREDQLPEVLAELRLRISA
jgi:hypothetical protein